MSRVKETRSLSLNLYRYLTYLKRNDRYILKILVTILKINEKYNYYSAIYVLNKLVNSEDLTVN